MAKPRRFTVCPICKVSFQARYTGRIYCSRKCMGQAKNPKCLNNLHRPKTGEFPNSSKGRKRPQISGENHPMFGRKHDPETRKTISLRTKEAWESGIYDEKYKANQRKAQKQAAKKRPNYKGGISSLANKIRGSAEYKLWRFQVFRRDHFSCTRCGRTGTIEAHHHPIPFRDMVKFNKICSLEEAVKCLALWDIQCAVTLCIECHAEVDTWRRKSSKNQ